MEPVFAFAAAGAVVAGLGFELRLFAPSRAPRRREAIVWSAGWLLLAIAVAAGIALTGGPTGDWTTVYLIERSLSLDNVFLFSLLLAYFLVPEELRGRVIVIGIAGALLLRAVAIAGGLALIESVEAVVYVFGVLLFYVAYRAFRGAAEQSDRLRTRRSDSSGATSRSLTTSAAAGSSSAKMGTPLWLVVIAIIAADIAFAVDSIPAALAVTRDSVVIWTANAFALVLAFVGIKILIADLVHINDLGSLAVIAALISGGVIASLVADRLDPPHPAEKATRRPPRCSRELAPPQSRAHR